MYRQTKKSFPGKKVKFNSFHYTRRSDLNRPKETAAGPMT